MVKFCYNFAPDSQRQPDGTWIGPNTITFKVVEGDFQPSVVAPFDPQILNGNSQLYTALAATSPNGNIDGFHLNQLLYSAALNAFQPDQWPTGLLVWVPEESELQIQVDGVKVATMDLDTGEVTPVE